MNWDSHEEQHGLLIELIQKEQAVMTQITANAEKTNITMSKVVDTLFVLKIINSILWFVTLASLSLAVWNYVIARQI